MPIALKDPVTVLTGVGPKMAEKLARLHIDTIRDLLFHLPLRYQDRTQLTRIGALSPGREAVIEGTVELAQIAYGRRRAFVVRLSDGTGALLLRFFHFGRSQQTRFSSGRHFRCFGEVRRGPQSLEMIHPECHELDPRSPTPLATTLTPIYPSTEGVTQARLRTLIDQCIPLLQGEHAQAVRDLLPTPLLRELQLPSLELSLDYVHHPPADVCVQALRDGSHPTQQRLAFEELLAHQLSLKRIRKEAQRKRAPALPVANALRRAFLAGLGFTPTAAQTRVITEIDGDLARANPMLRLLQGDVGSGKTAVAAAIALNALANGYQAALMAPTELLAEQHRRTLAAWYTQLELPVVGLTGRLGQAQRREILARVASTEPCLVIGTHALFQSDVNYAALGLVIVDEQHRFGVHQRLALSDKARSASIYAHQLIMTATPIPRTLAMTAYADLDVSVLDELPPNREPARTVAIPDTRRDEVVQRIAHACATGRQAYWVCPLIDESDLLEAQAASETLESLSAALPDLRIDLVHGRLSNKDKTRAMTAFSAHELDLLVATTVIEVGVDVPNASLMIIENAERLGLSQLHQLRGRVGRGAGAADCILLYKTPLNALARQRLNVMRESNDGFVIAEHDLRLRGPGELLGTKQTGDAEFRIADLRRDHALLPLVQRSATQLLGEDPALAAEIIERWMAGRIEYGHV